MPSVMPFTFNAVELCIVTINGKPRTSIREVCRVLEYGKATKVSDIVKHLCSREDYAHKLQLTWFFSETKLVDWPKESQKYIITLMMKGCMSCYLPLYTDEEGMYELLFSSQQSKAKDFRRHCCNVLFPHVREQLTNKMKEDNQQAIEEKDAAIALLNDDLKNREYENMVLQAQRDVYQTQVCDLIINRHVPRAKDPGKDNIVMIRKTPPRGI